MSDQIPASIIAEIHRLFYYRRRRRRRVVRLGRTLGFTEKAVSTSGDRVNT